MNILFFDDLGSLFHFFMFRLMFFYLRLLSWSSEAEHNPKTNILFFDDLGGLFHFFYGLVDVFCSDRLADHQKLNIIQKWTFDFLMT